MRQGTLRLSSVASGLRSVVPPAVAAFGAIPEINLQLSEGQPSSILRLRRGEIDAGMIVTASRQPLPLHARKLRATQLIEQSLVVAVPTSSSLASAPRLTLRQFETNSRLLPDS